MRRAVEPAFFKKQLIAPNNIDRWWTNEGSVLNNWSDKQKGQPLGSSICKKDSFIEIKFFY